MRDPAAADSAVFVFLPVTRVVDVLGAGVEDCEVLAGEGRSTAAVAFPLVALVAVAVFEGVFPTALDEDVLADIDVATFFAAAAFCFEEAVDASGAALPAERDEGNDCLFLGATSSYSDPLLSASCCRRRLSLDGAGAGREAEALPSALLRALIAREAGVSPFPSPMRSSTPSPLVMNWNMVLMTLLFWRISSCWLRTSARMRQIAFESCMSEWVFRKRDMSTPIIVNSIGETRAGLLNAALYLLSFTNVMKMRNVSSTASRVLAGTGVGDESHFSSRGTPGKMVLWESMRCMMVARHWKSLPRSCPQSRSSPKPSSPSTIDWTSRISAGHGPGIACMRSGRHGV